MTSGMSEVTGTLSSLNCPLVSVSVEAMGLPDTVPHFSHVAPVVMGSSGALGT
jgi:hypothetical protein